MKKKSIILTICILSALVIVLFLRGPKPGGQAEPIRISGFKLNTVVEITIYDSTDESLLEDALGLCDHYEDLFSRTKETSELFKLNHRTLPKSKDGWTVSPETAELILQGLKYSQLSHGAFDITIEPVSSLWDFTSEDKVVPAQAQIEQALPHVGWQKVQVQGSTVTFADDDTRLDLGAIAKGYIADRIKAFLMEKGVQSATINLGGNVLCIGDKLDGSPFKIGIQKPFADRNETIAVVDVSGRSVVSSGIYERFFEKDGTLYHHLLNPQNGYPYDNGLVAVSIISSQSVDGDGLSTACFALGLEKGMALIDSLDDVQAIFITDDYQVHYSQNFDEELSAEQVQTAK
ncbi:MAG: FAD:protein FMN transferase [Blautia sp.]|jgi:thiamine biosynthesis lipoprotein